MRQRVLALKCQHKTHQVLDRLRLHTDFKFVIAVKDTLIDRVGQLAFPEWTILAVHECELAVIGQENCLLGREILRVRILER